MSDHDLHALARKLTGGVAAHAIEHEALERAALAGELHLLDVREPHEYAAGHLPHAVNHPLSAFNPDALPKDKPVVLVCQAGGRSMKAMQAAHDAGRTDVMHYAPGTGGWKARGGRIVM